MVCYNNFKLGKCLNIETHYNQSLEREVTISRELRKLHRGWGKHRIEDETCTTYCARLGKYVQYQKGKPRGKKHGSQRKSN